MRKIRSRFLAGACAMALAVSGAFSGVGMREVKAAGEDCYVECSCVVIEEGGTTKVYPDTDENGVKDTGSSPICDDVTNCILASFYDSTLDPLITMKSGELDEVILSNGSFSTIRFNMTGGTVRNLVLSDGGVDADVSYYKNDAKSSEYRNYNKYAITVNISGSASVTQIETAGNYSRAFINNTSNTAINPDKIGAYYNDGGFLYIDKSNAILQGKFRPVQNLSLTVPLTIRDMYSSLIIPSGLTFSTTSSITNNGRINCDGSFPNADRFLTDENNTICFPLSVTHDDDDAAVLQNYLTLKADPDYSDANNTFGSGTQIYYYVKAGSSFDVISGRTGINHIYYDNGTKTKLTAVTSTKFRGTMPAQATELHLSTSEFSTKQSPTVSNPGPFSTTYGKTLANITLPSVNSGETPGTFQWVMPTSTSVGNVGANLFDVKFVPTDATTYSEKTFSVTVNVAKATITTPSASSITIPAVESGTNLSDIVVSSYGNDKYTCDWESNQVLNETGSHNLLFTLKDSTNYKFSTTGTSTATVAVTVTVNESAPICNHNYVWYSLNDNNHCKKCSKCNELDLTTTAAHTLVYNSNSTTHWYVCSVCGYTTTPVSHSYTTYGHNSTTHWKTCECGAQSASTNHNYTTYGSDGTKHWKTCECGAQSASTNHNYTTYGSDGTKHWKICECGAQTASTNHSYTTYGSDGTNHWKVCECGAETTPVNHVFTTKKDGNTHWSECSDCGYTTTPVNHVYTTDKDANTHWGKCTTCGYATTPVNHVFTTKNNSTQHWDECSSCGYTTTKVNHSYTTKKDDTYHWTECACGATTTKVAHVYTANKDETAHWTECTCGATTARVDHVYNTYANDNTYHWRVCSCGAQSTKTKHTVNILKTDDTGHWYECSCGFKGTKSAHDYDTPNKDGDYHWSECMCGAKSGIEAHSYTIDKKDATHHWKECSCGAQSAKTAHSFTIAKYTASTHWMQCSCGEKSGEATHTLGDYVNNGNGTHTRGCSGCAYSVTENHTLATRTTKIPTKTEKGEQETYCSKCGVVTNKEELDIVACDHPTAKRETVIMKADSRNTGSITVTCKDCNNVIVSETIPKTVISYGMLEAVYGQTLSDLTLPENTGTAGTFTWIPPTTTSVGNAGKTYNFSIMFTPDDTEKYNSESCTLKVTVVPAKKKAPTLDTLSVRRGSTLSTIALPASDDYTFAWKDGSTQVLKNESFPVICTMKDSNYVFTDTNEATTEVNVSVTAFDEKVICDVLKKEVEATYGTYLKDIELPKVEGGKLIYKDDVLNYTTTLPDGQYKFYGDITSKKVDKTGTYPTSIYFEPSVMGYSASDPVDYNIKESHVHDYSIVKGKTKHYKQCSVCGNKTTEVDHNYAYKSTGSDGHYRECSECGAKTSISDHIFGAVIVDQSPRVGVKGSGHRVCNLCSYVESNVEIPEEPEDQVDPVEIDGLPMTATALTVELGKTLDSIVLPRCESGKWYLGAVEVAGDFPAPDGKYVLSGDSKNETDPVAGQKLLLTGKDVELVYAPNDEGADVLCTAFTVTIPVKCINHKFGDWEYKDEHDHVRTCSLCGVTETKSHTEGDLTGVDGEYHTKECTVCGHELVKEAHDFRVTSRVDPTKDEDGEEIHTCSKCNYEKTVILERQGKPDYDVPTDLLAVYGGTLEDVILPEVENGRFEWPNKSLSVGNVGSNKFTLTFVPNDENYYTDSCTVYVQVTPKRMTFDYSYFVYSLDESGKIGDPISTVDSIEEVDNDGADYGSYSWYDPDQSIVANGTYQIIFIPDDTENYEWEKPEWMKDSVAFYDEDKHGFVFDFRALNTYTEGSSEDLDKNEAQKINAMVSDIGEPQLTPEFKAMLDSIKASYDALTEDQKRYVKDSALEKLDEAYEAYDKLVEEEKRRQEAADKAAAESVIATIYAIGEVDYNETCLQKIVAAENAYNGLTDAQKALIGDDVKAILTNARTLYDRKEAVANQPIPDSVPAPVIPVTPAPTPTTTSTPSTTTPAKVKAGAKGTDTKTGMKYEVATANLVGGKKTDFVIVYKGTTKTSAAKLSVPASVKIGTKSYKVAAIDSNAFKGNKKLKEITIPANIMKIGAKAFYGCVNLNKVTFAKNSLLESIGNSAFYNCKSLTQVKITSKKLKTVGTKAFTKAGSKAYKKFKILVPKGKKSKYTKLLKKAGLNKNCKVKQ